MLPAFSSSVPLRSWVTPNCPNSFRVVSMSRRRGTLSRYTVSAVSRLAHRMGRAAFLAPETVISPFRRCPPVMRNLSIRIGLVFVGGKRAHGQGVDFGFHPVAQGFVNQLVTRNQAFAFKGGADDQGLKVRTIALHLQVFTGQVVGNVLVNLFGGRQHEINSVIYSLRQAGVAKSDTAQQRRWRQRSG